MFRRPGIVLVVCAGVMGAGGCLSPGYPESDLPDGEAASLFDSGPGLTSFVITKIDNVRLRSALDCRVRIAPGRHCITIVGESRISAVERIRGYANVCFLAKPGHDYLVEGTRHGTVIAVWLRDVTSGEIIWRHDAVAMLERPPLGGRVRVETR